MAATQDGEVPNTYAPIMTSLTHKGLPGSASRVAIPVEGRLTGGKPDAFEEIVSSKKWGYAKCNTQDERAT